MEEVLELIIDHRGRTPKKLGGNFASAGVRVISAKNVYAHRLHIDDDTRFVNEDLARRWMPKKLAAGDVLLTSEAPLGEVAYLSRDTDHCLGQRLFGLRADDRFLDGRFLYYALRSSSVRAQLSARASGTTAQGIRQAELRQVQLALPPLPEQRRVAATLGALDEKIDSNGRLAQLLEESVATLFRARFVDFVGERDFVETELGHFPKEWSVAPIGDVLKVVGGGTPSTKEPRYWLGGKHCWATPKDLAGARFPVLLDTARYITDEGVRRISSKLLPKRTVLLSSRAPIGYTTMSLVDVAVNQGFIAIPPSDAVPSEYVLLWLRENMDRIKAHAGGTTFAEISKRAFRPLLMPVPPAWALTEFEQAARPMFDLLAGQEREMQALSKIRESLLPKLISGEIRVPDTIDPDQVIGPVGERIVA